MRLIEEEGGYIYTEFARELRKDGAEKYETDVIYKIAHRMVRKAKEEMIILAMEAINE